MSFKSTIQTEFEDKYLQMMTGQTKYPFEKNSFDTYESFANKNVAYHKRIEKEKDDFNGALSQVQNRYNNRIEAENSALERALEQRAKSKYKRSKALKTLTLLLPIIIAALTGVDVFMNKFTREETIEYGWVIAGWVIFTLISLAVSIVFLRKLFVDETYINRNKIPNAKKLTKIAITVFIIYLIIIIANLSQIIPNLGKDKIIYVIDGAKKYEYIEKDETVRLPDYKREPDVKDGYTTKYTFDGWIIDGKLYKAGDRYDPDGWETAEAKLTKQDWCSMSIYASNATVTIKYDGYEQSFSSSSEIEIPRGKSVTVEASFSYSNSSFSVDYSTVASPYTFTIKKNSNVSASSESPGCLAEGTMITLADGTKKAVENLEMGDILIAFNHETGRYEPTPLLANVHASVPAQYYDVITLHFSNESSLRIVDEHGLYDSELNKYVYITDENAFEFVGHEFVCVSYEDSHAVNEFVTLERVELTNEYIKIYNPATVWHINLIANDMLTLSAGMTNLFAYDENMKYDAQLMSRDIEEYGLYTYEDFEEYVPTEVFNVFPFKYYKAAVEKGEFSYERLLGLIGLYYDKNSLN